MVLYGNAARTQEQVKINTTASVCRYDTYLLKNEEKNADPIFYRHVTETAETNGL